MYPVPTRKTDATLYSETKAHHLPNMQGMQPLRDPPVVQEKRENRGTREDSSSWRRYSLLNASHQGKTVVTGDVF